jgi:hypothetical protein
MRNSIEYEDKSQSCEAGPSSLTGDDESIDDNTHPSTYGEGQAPNDVHKKIGSITDKEYHG